MRNGESNMYGGLCTLRNGVLQRQWLRAQAFLVFNSVAVPIALGTNQPDPVIIVISIVGSFTHVGISLVAWESVRHLEHWDEALAELERLDRENPDNATRVTVFSLSEFEHGHGEVSAYAYLFPFGSGIILWLILASVHIASYLHI